MSKKFFFSSDDAELQPGVEDTEWELPASPAFEEEIQERLNATWQPEAPVVISIHELSTQALPRPLMDAIERIHLEEADTRSLRETEEEPLQDELLGDLDEGGEIPWH